jgi:hypothetical protein
MKVGMLWFDNDPKTPIEKKIEKAVQYYKDKYARDANTCYVNPSMIPEGQESIISIPGVDVIATRSVLPNNFWIGIDNQKGV